MGDKQGDFYVCKTEEDYVVMHDDASLSCMSVRDVNYGPGRDEVYSKLKLWPSIFYHYHPHLLGCFIRHETTIARCVIVLNEHKKPIYYTSMYAYTPTARVRLHDHIRKLYGDLRYTGYVKNPVFDVPNYKFQFKDVMRSMCPIPFFDGWDPETKIICTGNQWRIGSNNDKAVQVDCQYEYDGWIVKSTQGHDYYNINELFY